MNYKTITINERLKNLPFYVIGYKMDVVNTKTAEVNQLFNKVIEDIKNKYCIEEVTKIPKLKISRDGYKKLGIDPSRYRLACESLVRRVVKGFDCYRLGDVIDLGNILSLLTHRSVCVVDYDKVKGNVLIETGHKEDIYEGINRGLINITNMPAYKDDVSYFGTPTSDTIRTAITSDTKTILIMLICFDDSDMEQDENLLLDLYKKYAGATNVVKLSVN